MAQKYYNTAETAKILGKSVDDIRQMLEHRELHGYRDGADWKFKVEDIDRLAKLSPPAKPADGAGDVLLSEVELGQSDTGLSGTVIGLNGGARSSADSDIALSALSDSSKAPAAKKPQSDLKAGKFEKLGLDDDLTLSDSSIVVDDKKIGGGSSVIDLGGGASDDDLVLGGSDASSDVTVGGDSGISLVDPADSGLSLETPVSLGPAAEESLELREDDMLAPEGKAGTDATLKTDDDFLLTPLEEASDAEDSASGSQVIALDAAGDEAGATLGGGVSMAAMLDDDLGNQPVLDLGTGAPLAGAAVLGAPSGALADGVALGQPVAFMAETPYTTGQIVFLSVCFVFLMLCGMMLYDLLRSMWSWEQPTWLNSKLMDMILGWFGN
jgi:excisionase family DNA binding protein